ncbi:MAG: DJ-1/PfpI family protein [Solirubrobacterales bacterium]
MDAVFLLFPEMTPLDAVGPYEVLKRVPGTTVKFVAKEPGEQKAEDHDLGLVADLSFEDVKSADVLVIPGGLGTRKLIHDKATLKWIREIDETSEWTTSVCTGSLLLAAAGLLENRPATTHWLEMDLLAELGADATKERVVRDEKYVTSGGVSAGIDMAIMLVSLMHDDTLAMAMQLAIEYDPHPQFDAGSPNTAPPELVELVRAAAKMRQPS